MPEGGHRKGAGTGSGARAAGAASGKGRAPLVRLLAYLRPYRGWVAASAGLLMVRSLLEVAGPYLTKVAIDRYLSPAAGERSPLDPWLSDHALEGLDQLAILYLAVLAAGFVARYWQIWWMHNTGQRAVHDLRVHVFAHLRRMSASYYDQQPVGKLVTRVTSDVGALNELFTSGVVAIFGDLLTLVAIFGAMLYLSPSLTLVLLTVAPPIVLLMLWFRTRARAAHRDIRGALGTMNAFLEEHISSMTLIQLFSHERRSYDEFHAINTRHRDAEKRALHASSFFFSGVELMGSVAIAVLLLYGGWRVIGGTLELGVIVAFLQYGARVFRPLQDLSAKYNLLQAAIASSERIFAVLDTPAQEPGETTPASQDGPAAAAPAAPVSSDPRIEFRNVWFAYRDQDWVLRDVSFSIEPGETLAVVGHTGAGKTTLTNLLLRFYDAQRGAILVGGLDIREWDLERLRRHFGVVLQDPCMFRDSLEYNISLGDPEISLERVKQVAREVHLAEFVESLPEKYQTPLDERGDSISWGQKQLVSFARALARRPRILILDEATSSVDSETERKIRDAIPRLTSGHTSIVIAHRLSTIRHANRVLVLHHGEVRELGTHKQLLEKRQIYWRLHQLQFGQSRTG